MTQDSRPHLNALDLEEAMAQITGHRPGHVIITMSEGQWDAMLEASYSAGFTLLEVNDEEIPVRAYCRKGN